MRCSIGVWICGLSAVLALAACDQPEWRKIATAKPGAPGAYQTSGDPVPARPTWLLELEGRPLAAAYSRQAECVGNAEAVTMAYAGSPGGSKIVGWGWAVGERVAPAKVILVDGQAKVVGGGESGLERLDVPNAQPAVTSVNTGWWALTTVQHGRVEAYGVLPDGETICKLGQLDL